MGKATPGSDKLFEIPTCLEFFGLGIATPEKLRDVAPLPT